MIERITRMGDDAIVPSPLGIYKMGDDTGGGPIIISGLGDFEKIYKSSEDTVS